MIANPSSVKSLRVSEQRGKPKEEEERGRWRRSWRREGGEGGDGEGVGRRGGGEGRMKKE